MKRVFNISFWKQKALSLKSRLEQRKAAVEEDLRKSRIRQQAKVQQSKGVFAVEIKNHLGIGARLIWCLEIILFCKEHRLKPSFKFSYNGSDVSEDYFGAFFQTDKSSGNADWITIKTIGDLGFAKNYNRELTLETAHQLITEYLVLRPEITMEVNEFFQQQLHSEKTLGLHYRNTDKKSEASPVTYENVLLNLDFALKQHPELKRIFVSSDDKLFIDFMKRSHLSGLVCMRDDSFRSPDGIAIHERGDVNKYDINKDAIVNMMILSKCSFVLKTASILSSCSLLFNPEIPFAMLNRPFDNKLWFPESELLNRVEYAAKNE